MVRGYSELRVVLTARNEASRTLRRVGRDLGKIGQQDALKSQIKQIQNRQKQISAQRALTQSEFESLTSGKQRLKLDAQILAQKNAIRKAQDAVKNAQVAENKATSANQAAQLRNQKRTNEVEKQLSSRRISAFRRAQLQLEQEALQIDQRRLQKQAKQLPVNTTRARSNVITQNKALQGLYAAETELGVRANVASSKVKVLADQLELAKQKEMALKRELNKLNFHELQQGARSAIHLGTALATVGAIATVSFGLAAKHAAEFSKEVTLAATQARPIGQSFAATAKIADNLTGIVLKQMQKFPASSQAMADSLYEIFSGTNIQAPKIAAKNLEILNKAAVAGGTDLGTMTQAGITLLNNFVGKGKEFSSLTSAVDLFFSAVRYGRFSAEQFATSLSNVVPIAETAGLTFRDVADAMAILTRQSGAKFTSRDATGLARLIEIFGKPGIQAGLHKMGIEVEKTTGGMRPLLDIMKEIKDKANLKPGANTLNFFKTLDAAGSGGKGNAGTIQARRTFAFLIENMGQYEKVADKVNKTQGEFNASFRAMAQTPGVKWDILVNQMKALVILIGQEAIPVFEKLGFIIVKTLHYFNNMDPSTRRLIVQIGVFASVGSLVLGVLTAMAGSMLLIGLAISRLRFNYGLLSKLGFKLAEAEGAANVAMLAKIGIIGALLAVIVKYPQVLGQTVKMLGGFQNALTLITIAAFTNSLIKMAAQATKATETLGALRLALLRLSLIGMVVIGVELVVHKEELDNIEKSIKDKLSGIPGIGGAFKSHPLKAMDLFDPNEVKRMADAFGMDFVNRIQAKAKAQMTLKAKSMGKTLAEMLGVPSKQAMSQALDTEHGMPDVAGAWERFRNLKSVHAEAKVIAAETDADFVKGINNLIRLQQVSDNATTVASGLKAWKRYQAALDDLTARFPQYKDAISGLISAFDQLAQVRMPDAAFNKAFAKVNALRKLAEKSTDPKLIEKYHKAEDALSKKSADTQMQAAQEAASNADSLREEQIQKAKEAADKAAQIAKDAAEKAKQLAEQNVANAKNAIEAISGNVFQFYQSALEQNKSAMGELFNGPFMNSAVMQNRNQFGFSARPKDILADAFSQLHQFNKFRTSLDDLKKRGAPAEMLDQIQQLGPEAQKQIDILNKFTPGQFKAYVNLFTLRQKAIQKATEKDLNSQIKKWESFGKKVARAIMQGISSETPGVETAVYNRILKMFPGLAAQGHLKAKPIPTAGGTTAATAAHMFALAGKNPGMLKAGNIDLLHRKVADAGGGKIATVESFSKNFDGKEVLLPAVINGIIRSQAFATKYYQKTGQNLGTFKDPKSADAYAQRLHNQQAAYYSGKKPMTPQYHINNNKTVHYNLPQHLAGSSLASQLKASYFHERNSD